MRFQNTVGTGTLTKLEIMFDENKPYAKVRLGVYADNNGKPGNLLLDAGEVAIANGWVSVSGLNLPVTGNTYYWLAFNLGYGSHIKTQSGCPQNSYCWVNARYGALPNAYPTPSGYDTTNYVMRATVNLGG
jgi:hypothetical protein